MLSDAQHDQRQRHDRDGVRIAQRCSNQSIHLRTPRKCRICIRSTARWQIRQERSVPPLNRRQCSDEGFRSQLATQRMDWQGTGNSLGWFRNTCSDGRSLLRAIDSGRPPLTPPLGSAGRRIGARFGMEHPQPLGLLGKVIETVSQRRKRRTEKRERTGRETRKRSPQQQDEDHPDSRSSSGHALESC